MLYNCGWIFKSSKAKQWFSVLRTFVINEWQTLIMRSFGSKNWVLTEDGLVVTNHHVITLIITQYTTGRQKIRTKRATLLLKIHRTLETLELCLLMEIKTSLCLQKWNYVSEYWSLFFKWHFQQLDVLWGAILIL